MSRSILFTSIVLTGVLLGLVCIWFFLLRESKLGSRPSVQSDTTKESHTVTDYGNFYRIDATYPTTIPLNLPQKARTVLETFIKKEVSSFKAENIAPLTAQDIEVMGLGGDRVYVLSIDYVFFESDKTVSYVFTLFTDTLGAHPNTLYKTFTFARATGQEIALSDLFTTSSYLATLSTLSRQALVPLIAKTTGSTEDEVDNESIASGTQPKRENFQHFYLDGKDLVLIFPPYQVGPYVIGRQEVRTPLTELSSIFKSEYR